MPVILGIDPGSRITGFGVIKVTGNHHAYLTCGCITTTTSTTGERLHQIYTQIKALIQQFQPDEAAIEDLFFHQNPKSALKLGQARGAAIVAASEQGIPIAEYSARQIKQSVVGYGAAKKEQVSHMVKRLLTIHDDLPVDGSDALAVAITHAHMRQGIAQLLNTRKLRRGRMR